MTVTRACEPITPLPRPHPRHWPSVTAAALTATVTVMPGFVVGALAPVIETGLGMSRSALGLALSSFYAATALGSPVAKRVAARLPVHVVLATAALIAAAVMLAAAQAEGMASLTTALVVGGLGNALVQPAAGRLIATRTPAHRRSLAAGIVGAALAAATLVPGLLVALVVPAYGWRTALLTAGLIALIPVALTPLARSPHRPQPAPPATAAPRRVGGTLAWWSVAAALSAAGNNAVATYFVQLGTDSGLPAVATGNLLALSALLAIAIRIAAGALTDRAPRRNPAVIASMMLAGGLGLALISAGTPVSFVLGAILAFSAGWGWTGLLLATALQLVPDSAEHAGHTVQVGIYTGATIAPFAFATLSGAVGHAPAALVCAAAAFAGAGAVVTGALLLRGRPGR
ncbi:MFS transporter [Streptomyces sp. NPDC052012]|uniref:MFS transporter n=1 Tax=Streptomyces sp. NPDC052012 TaxID=3155051 RepID=UPI003450D126